MSARCDTCRCDDVAQVRKRTYVGDDDPKLVETIERDIISQDVGVSFDDIAVRAIFPW